MQQLEEECVKSENTASLWQEYSRLRESSSARLEGLRLQWEELLDSVVDTQAVVHTVEVSYTAVKSQTD